jgi:hypothetical protein
MRIGDLVEHFPETGIIELLNDGKDFKAALITDIRRNFYRVIPVGKTDALWYSEEELKLISKG